LLLPGYNQMKSIQHLHFISFSVIILLSFSSSVLAKPKLDLQSKVQLNGIAAIRVGMTVSEATKAAKIKLVSIGETNNECYYVQPQSGLKHLSMMVVRGRVARIDINQGSSIKTLSGAGIGDSEQRISSLYHARIEVSPHQYIRGHYLTFIPTDRVDRNYRLIFETDGRKVISYRAGRMPEVGYIEGCS
jgi:hypothetical protein